MLQSDVVSVSLSKSSENPTHGVGKEKTLEGSFDPSNPNLGLNVSATETVTISMKPWKFEQSAHGNTVILNWFLHDVVKGREVFSSKPSKMALLQPRAWFRDRYSSAYRPFTKRGEVIFASDVYGESVRWKVRARASGKKMEWEIKGWIWWTYWPNGQNKKVGVPRITLPSPSESSITSGSMPLTKSKIVLLSRKFVLRQ
ncbi:hypothetical protein COCNU_16G006090 [Cocos nucifera]|uniref:Uncharacterized protein n=1 Tax=Cocos nucifera TaxID=13894 RepID=A0A8K0IYH4_COCNU|nr:hypothetical protein COCNU_16G006090 [Cocos nucifera]